MKKIKVLHKVSANIGGIERYVFNNMEYVNRDKFQFDFLTQNKNFANTDEYKRYQFGIKYFSVTDRDNKELFIKEINDILDEGEYDIFHLHTGQWTGLLLEEIAMQKKVPKVIVHSHCSERVVPQLEFASSSPETLAKYSQLHEFYKSKFTEYHATDFWACSQAAADWLFGSQIPRNKIRIMKNAIDLDKYRFKPTIRKEVREQLGIENCFVLGHVGRMVYEKNHTFLIDVFQEVYKRNKKARLLLIGSGDLEDNIRSQVKKYGLQDVVLFGGWRNDVARILQAMDLFLLPSRYEGLGLVLIEAQAAGLKCICSNNVPEEASVTCNIEFFPLDINDWTDRICKIPNVYDRADMDEIITKSGYNIKFAINELEKLYES